MNEYIATFYSHFGAIRYEKKLKQLNIEAKRMPVPRLLSSSCGVCVKYNAEKPYTGDPDFKDEIEKIVLQKGGAYEIVFEAGEE